MEIKCGNQRCSAMNRLMVEHFSGPIASDRKINRTCFFSPDEGFLTESPHLLRNWSLDLKAVKAEITKTCRKFLLLLSGGIPWPEEDQCGSVFLFFVGVPCSHSGIRFPCPFIMRNP